MLAFATQPRGVHPPEYAPPSAEPERKNFEHCGESEVFVKRLSRSGNTLTVKGCDFGRTMDEIKTSAQRWHELIAASPPPARMFLAEQFLDERSSPLFTDCKAARHAGA